ncbi:MAG: translation initiation factor 2 [Bacillota bacterium]
MNGEDQDVLKERLIELEERIESLRVSRRVLMNLIENMEKEKRSALARLEKENYKLQQSNSKYARTLLRMHKIILDLQSQPGHEPSTTP